MSLRATAISVYQNIGDSPRIVTGVNPVTAIPVVLTKILVMSSLANADADHMSAEELAINQSKVIIPARWISSFTKESYLELPM